MRIRNVQQRDALQRHAVQIQLYAIARQLDELVKVLARGRKGFAGRVFKVPKFVLHSRVELVRIFFALQVELHAYGSIDTNC